MQATRPPMTRPPTPAGQAARYGRARARHRAPRSGPAVRVVAGLLAIAVAISVLGVLLLAARAQAAETAVVAGTSCAHDGEIGWTGQDALVCTVYAVGGGTWTTVTAGAGVGVCVGTDCATPVLPSPAPSAAGPKPSPPASHSPGGTPAPTGAGGSTSGPRSGGQQQFPGAGGSADVDASASVSPPAVEPGGIPPAAGGGILPDTGFSRLTPAGSQANWLLAIGELSVLAGAWILALMWLRSMRLRPYGS